MELIDHERFLAGNEELRQLLRRANGVSNADGRATEADLLAIQARLQNLTPAIGDASRGETLDARLLGEVAEYINNLRALQTTIERIRNAPVDRRAPSENPKRQVESLESWLHEQLQTA
jgi:hypothetical protein